MYLRFTPDAPQELGFEVQRATFELDLLALLEFAYEQRDFCEHRRNVPGQDVDTLVAAWHPTIEVLEDLVAKTAHGEIADAPSVDHSLSDCVAPMVAERQYRTVNCPACSKTHDAGSVVEEDFGDDEGIVGGHRYVCPEKHILFVFLRFDTRA